jgi:hypothetical protein
MTKLLGWLRHWVSIRPRAGDTLYWRWRVYVFQARLPRGKVVWASPQVDRNGQPGEDRVTCLANECVWRSSEQRFRLAGRKEYT